MESILLVKDFYFKIQEDGYFEFDEDKDILFHAKLIVSQQPMTEVTGL